MIEAGESNADFSFENDWMVRSGSLNPLDHRRSRIQIMPHSAPVLWVTAVKCTYFTLFWQIFFGFLFL
jgi:hypothetical protein